MQGIVRHCFRLLLIIAATVCLYTPSASPQPLARYSDQNNSLFANNVASAGDINGDGFDDVVVGAPYYDSSKPDSGAALLYLGSSAGIESTPSWSYFGEDAQHFFGSSVARAGDVNGDGFVDILVGAPHAGPNLEGKVYLFLGGNSGLSSIPSSVVTGASKTAICGHSVASAGDVNRDGFDDIIIGSPSFSNGELAEGQATIYLGTATGLSPTPYWSYESNSKDALFGYSVASAGDVNNDGYVDIVVGALQERIPGTGAGRAYLFLGGATGVSSVPSWTYEDALYSGQLGVSVSSAGDTNGDGYADVVVGEHGYKGNVGRAYLFMGSESGLKSTADWSVTTTSPAAQLGYSVASAGDLNGDGLADITIGAREFEYNGARVGLAMVFIGRRGGLAQTPDWWAVGDTSGAAFGLSVSSAGDINHDGKADLLVGAPYAVQGSQMLGAAYQFFGNPVSIIQGPTPPPLGAYMPGLGPTPAPTATSTTPPTASPTLAPPLTPSATPTVGGAHTGTPTTTATPTLSAALATGTAAAVSTPSSSTSTTSDETQVQNESPCAKTITQLATRGRANVRMLKCTPKTASRFRGQWALRTAGTTSQATTQCTARGQQQLSSLSINAVGVATTDACSWRLKPTLAIEWKTGAPPSLTLQGINDSCSKKLRGATVRRAQLTALPGTKNLRISAQIRARRPNCSGWYRWSSFKMTARWP